MQQIEFRVGAKAARLIGRENIADVDGALIELIKNAYDADASCVYVDFSMPFPDVPSKIEIKKLESNLNGEEFDFVRSCYEEKRKIWQKREDLSEEQQQKLRKILFSHNRIIVADNGTGMTMDVVESAWMYIGTSDKEHHVDSAKGRIKTGAKGIGRFALDKLSTESMMYTKSKESQEIVQWSMNWDQFAQTQLIDDVKAEVNLTSGSYGDIVRAASDLDEKILEEHDWSSGTMLVMSPIREGWSDRLFNKVNTNLKSINPIGSVDRFEVIVHNVYQPDYSYQTEKVAIDQEDYDYRIKAGFDGDHTLTIRLLRNEVDQAVRSVHVEKYGASTNRSTDEFWSREKLQKDRYRRSDYNQEITLTRDVEKIFPTDELEKIKRTGPFSAEMYFLRNTNSDFAIMKKFKVSKRKKLLSQFSGVKIYRDDFKVRPYGDEGAMYDWLGMGTRVQKSPAAVTHQHGAWRVQPYQMIGLVKIGRKKNPNLEDMANREGIALTDTYYIFVDMLQECLKEFEFDRQYIYREYAKWIKSIEDELSDFAEKVKEEAIRRASQSADEKAGKDDQAGQASGQESEGEPGAEPDSESGQDSNFTEDEFFGTVYKMMQDSEKELNSKQMLQVLSSSGILLNTFFHEFNAINTQFHVQASQIRSRVNYILKGQEYEGLPAYNPYTRIDALEKNDKLTAAFLDVIMDGMKKDNLKSRDGSLSRMIVGILDKWKLLLEEKHITLNLIVMEEAKSHDYIHIALVDLYIILNNVILNAAWFLEKSHNPERSMTVSLIYEENNLYLDMENNGPALAERFRDNPDKIFEIGESGKEQEGTGLGLWVVKETVERCNGTVSVMDKKDGFGLRVIWKAEERSE